jgi:hypothetical protein
MIEYRASGYSPQNLLDNSVCPLSYRCVRIKVVKIIAGLRYGRNTGGGGIPTVTAGCMLLKRPAPHAEAHLGVLIPAGETCGVR